MSERFTRLFLSERNLYIEGCPVVVEGSALLKDNENNRLFAQLKFQNITNKTIKSIAIKLKLFDNADRELDEIINYTYLDLSFNRDNVYGDKTPVSVRNLQARSFKICISEVVFKDNSIYQSDSFDLQSIKEPQLLSSYFNNTDLEEQYSLECDTDAIYVPTKDRDLWICTCGEINREDEKNCHICGCSLEASVEKLDKAKLEAKVKERSYTQALSLMEQNNIESFKKAQTLLNKIDTYMDSQQKAGECTEKIEKILTEIKKKNKKIVAITIPAICVVLALIVFFCVFLLPNIKYNSALSYIEKGNYIEAYQTLKELGDYKDSFEKAKEIYETDEYKVQYNIQVIKKSEIGDFVTFGKYEQDNHISNGREDITWIVLEKQEDRVLVISKNILDFQPYNATDTETTWKFCTLRSWLNSDFLNKAFSGAERKLIPTVPVIAHENWKNVYAGSSTQDKVFLLSVKEADKYFPTKSSRECSPTIYARSIGSANLYGNSRWWLRSVGLYQNYAAYAFLGNSDDDVGTKVSYKEGVRPAMWIEIK